MKAKKAANVLLEAINKVRDAMSDMNDSERTKFAAQIANKMTDLVVHSADSTDAADALYVGQEIIKDAYGPIRTGEEKFVIRPA